MDKVNEILKQITKDIKIIRKKNKSNGNISYKLLLELIGGYSTEIPMINEDIQLINLLKSIGFENPVKSYALVEETSKDTQEKYICVRVDLADDTVLRYFLPKTDSGFRFKVIIEKLLDFTLKQNSEKQKTNK